MANTIYDSARKALLEGQLNMLTDTIKVIAVDTGAYSVNTATHQFLSDVPIGARVTPAAELVNKSTTGGAFDADDVKFLSVTGNSIEAVIIYKDTGSESTSPLILYLDTATGLPITPNGGDMILSWDNGSNKIFRP